MTRNILVLCFMMMTSSAHANDYTSYAECGAYFGVSAVMTKLSEKKAPDYAKDKYEKRYQFFLQGDNNLKRLAKNNPQYNEEIFDKMEKDAMDKIFADIDANGVSYLDKLNSILGQCIIFAGLDASDLPK